MSKYINYNLAPGEQLLECPYNHSHHIRGEKMGTHLLKCRRNYERELHRKGLELTYVNCNGNSNHIVVDKELMWHQSRCRETSNAVELEHAAIRKFAPPPRDYSEILKCMDDGENWEEELGGSCSKPFIYPKAPQHHQILRKPALLSNAEKDAWKKQQQRCITTPLVKTVKIFPVIGENEEAVAGAAEEVGFHSGMIIMAKEENQLDVGASKESELKNLTEGIKYEVVSVSSPGVTDQLQTGIDSVSVLSEDIAAKGFDVPMKTDVSAEVDFSSRLVTSLVKEHDSVCGSYNDGDDSADDDEYWDACSEVSVM